MLIPWPANIYIFFGVSLIPRLKPLSQLKRSPIAWCCHLRASLSAWCSTLISLYLIRFCHVVWGNLGSLNVLSGNPTSQACKEYERLVSHAGTRICQIFQQLLMVIVLLADFQKVFFFLYYQTLFLAISYHISTC